LTEPLLGSFSVARQYQSPRIVETYPRPGAHDLLGQSLDPLQEQGELVSPKNLPGGLLNQSGGQLVTLTLARALTRSLTHTAGCEGVLYSFLDQVVLCVPLRSAQVKIPHEVRFGT
jgi:hypothetical protein